MLNETHMLVSGNPYNSCQPPQYLLGVPVQVVSKDRRLGLTAVEYLCPRSREYKVDQFDSDCVERLQ